MTADFLLRLLRRSPHAHTRIHRDVSPQDLLDDHWGAITARLARACTELAKPWLNDDRTSRAESYASMPDWDLTAPKRYSKEGVNYVQVKVLFSVPPFVGLDAHDYSLQRGDVLLIPNANAQVLCARGLVVLTEQLAEGASCKEFRRLCQEGGVSVISEEC